MSLAASGMSPLAKASFESSGLAGIKRLRALQERLAEPDARHTLLEEFRAIHELITQSDRQLLLITEPEETESHLRDLQARWQQSSPPTVDAAFNLPQTREQVRAAWAVSTQVNFCAKAFPTVPAGHKDNAALHVLAGYLRNGFLHRAIREKGGAYGGGASQDAGSASFRFFSYRDPRLQDTLDDFDRAVDWLVNEEQPDYQLEEAILGVIASLDKPSSPAGEAKQAFYNRLFGRTLQMRQEFRGRVLDTTMEDLRRVAQTYLRPEQASIGVITNSDGLAEAALDGFEKYNLS
jgi:Zn-dependent M16 (insulinase) family peptidase